MCERDETAPQSTGCCQGPTALHTGFVLFLSEQNPPGHLELSPGAGPRAELVLWDLLQVTNIQQLQRTGCERQGPAHRSGDDAVTNKKKGDKKGQQSRGLFASQPRHAGDPWRGAGPAPKQTAPCLPSLGQRQSRPYKCAAGALGGQCRRERCRAVTRAPRRGTAPGDRYGPVRTATGDRGDSAGPGPCGGVARVT